MSDQIFEGEYGTNAPGMHRYLHKVDLLKTLKKKLSAKTRAMFDGFRERQPIGAPAPDFRLLSVDGRSVRLSDFLGKKHVVLEFGSYS